MQASVPKKRSGKQLDLKARRKLDRAEKAYALYKTVKTYLLHPGVWDDLAQVPGTEFTLINHQGKTSTGALEEGDYLKISIPGPKNQTGEGYDWVQVEKIEERHKDDLTLFSIRLRPCPNPENPDPEVAHFFTSLASSTLSVEQKGRVVQTRYYGRNEHINEANTRLIDRIRNLFVGGLAKSGASRLQWQNLIERLLDNHKEMTR